MLLLKASKHDRHFVSTQVAGRIRINPPQEAATIMPPRAFN